MPMSLRLLKTAISYNIDHNTINSLHFYDLQSLLLSMTADEIRKKIYMHNQTRMQSKGIDSIQHVSGKDILKFL